MWKVLRATFATAVRQLRRSPGFALTAILTLALGVAANVVVFGVLNALLLRPLNVAGADNLFQVVQQPEGYRTQSYPDYVDYRARNKGFRDLLAYRLNMLAFSAGATAEKRWMYEVSGNYFDMLKVQPQLGRVLHESDEHGPNSVPYIVLSDAFWRSRFHADPHVVGTTVNLNKHPFTIIGVAAQGFYGTELFIRPDFWIPMVNEEQVNGFNYLDKRFSHGLSVVGAIRPGVTPKLALDDLNSVAHQLAKEYPAYDDALSARLIKPGLMGDMGGAARPFLSGIMLLALLMLAAACTNLAGIFAARAADRARELAIRLSIGSTRLRILRQVLTEALLVSVAAGLIGTLVASALLDSLSRWQPFAEFPIHLTVAADARVYAIAFLLSMVSGLLPGLLPARQIWQTNAMQAMKSGGTVPSLPHRLTLRDLLLCVQIALCALLVTASLVSLRGMQRSLHAPIGFAPQGAVVAGTDMHMAGYTDESALPVQRRMIEQAGRIPGVSFAGTIDEPPLSTGGGSTPVWREGSTDLRLSNSALAPHYFSISPGYLQAAGTRLLAGRDFTWHDDQTKPKVVLVNQTFAQKMFGKVDAVGRHFLGSDKSLYEVVGVVEDGKYESLTEDPTAAMFYPLAQVNAGDTTVVVRSQLTPSETAAALNQVLASVDPSLPFTLSSWPQALAFVSVSGPCGHRSVRRDGPAGSHARRHRRLRHGSLFGFEATEGTRHSPGARVTEAATPACGAGPSTGPVALRFDAWPAVGSGCQQPARAPGLSGHPARSSRPDRGSCDHDAGGHDCHLDSRTPGLGRRPRSVAARRMILFLRAVRDFVDMRAVFHTEEE